MWVVQSMSTIDVIIQQLIHEQTLGFTYANVFNFQVGDLLAII